MMDNAGPRQMPLDNRSMSRAGWARKTAGSGRVSGAVAHLSTQTWSAAGDAIADRPPDAVYGRPQAHRRAAETSAAAVPYHLDTPLSFVWRRPV